MKFHLLASICHVLLSSRKLPNSLAASTTTVSGTIAPVPYLHAPWCQLSTLSRELLTIGVTPTCLDSHATTARPATDASSASFSAAFFLICAASSRIAFPHRYSCFCGSASGTDDDDDDASTSLIDSPIHAMGLYAMTRIPAERHSATRSGV